MRPIFRLLLAIIWLCLALIPGSWIAVAFIYKDISDGIFAIIIMGLPTVIFLLLSIKTLGVYLKEAHNNQDPFRKD